MYTPPHPLATSHSNIFLITKSRSQRHALSYYIVSVNTTYNSHILKRYTITHFIEVLSFKLTHTSRKRFTLFNSRYLSEVAVGAN